MTFHRVARILPLLFFGALACGPAPGMVTPTEAPAVAAPVWLRVERAARPDIATSITLYCDTITGARFYVVGRDSRPPTSRGVAVIPAAGDCR